jgi:hypothetical protein
MRMGAKTRWDMIDKTADEAAAMTNAFDMAAEFLAAMYDSDRGVNIEDWNAEEMEAFIECIVDGYVTKLAEIGEGRFKAPF